MSDGFSIPGSDSYALVIGIGDYQDPGIPKLRFTAADADAFHKRLTDPQQSGFNPDNVKLLLNEQATRRGIEQAIGRWLFKNANPESMVVVFFAGHGAVESDRTGCEKDGISKYLLPWDADREDLFSSALSNSRFHELLNTIKAERLVVFLDACYAAGVTEGARDIGIIEHPAVEIAKGAGRVVIASAGPNQRSWEDASFGHGIFTHHLLEAIDGGADFDNDGCVSVSEIFKYLGKTVPATARRLSNSLQMPMMLGEATDFSLTVNCQRRQQLQRELEEHLEDRRRKLTDYRKQGMPLREYLSAMELVEKPSAELEPAQRDSAALLDALLSGNMPLSVYLRFANSKWTSTPVKPPPEPVLPVEPRPPDPPPPLKFRFCINCGTAVVPEKKFCIGCGAPYSR